MRCPSGKATCSLGGARVGEIPGTGRVDRILINEKFQELRRESLLTDLHQRIRDVKAGPDGFIYVATDEETGAILRIEPADSRRQLACPGDSCDLGTRCGLDGEIGAFLGDLRYCRERPFVERQAG